MPAKKSVEKLVAEVNPRSPIAEAYRTIRTNIQFAAVARDIRVLLVTSTMPGEGKTATAANLAVVSAQAGKKVLLVDADLRKPQVHQRFQVSNLDGLSNALIKERPLSECIIQSPNTPGLWLLPSGPIPPNPSEMLASAAFSGLVEEMSREFDLLILDSPPVLSVADALILSQVAHGVLFVVDAQRTHRQLAQKAVAALRQVNAHLLGAVLNRVDRRGTEGYYYYYSHYYSSQATV
ncbi:tyrosine protein kinase [Alicyclobacillus cellulosilyticus]|uniref:non-specific protein-tyrosine kinase n=1 Tax=Alicyclobacillus cellulosilyticus TaxID=1003997 RepID=A0A917NJC2_9BACL|nr:CpsD/CapB family tyrosine-protein kinase [Alicyclobacillus cellulosilyticus]GGJ04812.1 tyrosine protein kinase [Alicyclobacillus cellulosilyticus]